jgi:hypothetical protein
MRAIRASAERVVRAFDDLTYHGKDVPPPGCGVNAPRDSGISLMYAWFR